MGHKSQGRATTGMMLKMRLGTELIFTWWIQTLNFSRLFKVSVTFITNTQSIFKGLRCLTPVWQTGGRMDSRQDGGSHWILQPSSPLMQAETAEPLNTNCPSSKSLSTQLLSWWPEQVPLAAILHHPHSSPVHKGAIQMLVGICC